MSAAKGTQIADAAHDLYNLVKQNCPEHYLSNTEFGENDFIARAWRKSMESARDALMETEQLEQWLAEKAELPRPTTRDENLLEPLPWQPPQSDNLKLFLAGEMSDEQIQSVQAGKISL
ncbi:MAG: hypothetical protein IH984_07495 [Planctomycetes bacterium]|nr:hypothetical protein [Planctomycetota bacterium]